MIAILLCTGFQEGFGPLLNHRPTPLLKIADKPMIAYIFEYLGSLGVKHIHLALHHHPEMIENFLGDGKRWGMTLTYHLVKDVKDVFNPLLPVIQQIKESCLIVGQGDVLPLFPLQFEGGIQKGGVLKSSFGTSLGWGLFTQKELKFFDKKSKEETVFSLLEEASGTFFVEEVLSTRSLEEWKNANQRVIQEKALPLELLLTSAKCVEPGVWIGRGVTLHPTAEIIPPVFIGQGVQINQKARIGPHVVLESNCLIDKDSSVKSSLVCSTSYVGEGLNIQENIVDRNILVNLNHQSTVFIEDGFILSELKSFSFSDLLLGGGERLFAFCLLLLSSPLWMFLWVTMDLKKESKLKLPALEDPSRWKSFDLLSFSKKGEDLEKKQSSFFKTLPYLINIIKGEMHFVGVSAKTKEEVETLSSDWKKLYLASKLGWITLADLYPSCLKTEDEDYAMDAFYSVHQGFFYDLKLILYWMKNRYRKKDERC